MTNRHVETNLSFYIMVMLVAEGFNYKKIAEQLSVWRQFVARWQAPWHDPAVRGVRHPRRQRDQNGQAQTQPPTISTERARTGKADRRFMVPTR